MKILNCRVFRCKFNDKGKCRLETISLLDIGSPIIGRIICIEAEPKDKDAETFELEIDETDWPENRQGDIC